MYLVINMMSVFVIIMKAMMLIVEGKTDGSLIIPPGNSGPVSKPFFFFNLYVLQL